MSNWWRPGGLEMKGDRRMKIEQAKDVLETLQAHMDYSEYDALDIAIKSLDMWNKVIEEIKNLNNENPLKNYRPWLYEDEVIEIIKKYIKEIEEWKVIG